jgi:hypothetical protein
MEEEKATGSDPDDGEVEVIGIDWDVFFAAAEAGDPVVLEILHETVQELFETTGRKLRGVKYETRFTIKDTGLVPFALDGDWEPLISYIEKGGDINRDDIRNFILDVLRGKKRPKRRPRLAATFLHHMKIASYVRECRADELGPEASIQKAMEEFNIDRRTVQRALKDCAG